MTTPRAFNHVGVGVADLDAAIAWYQDVLGFTLVSGPFDVRHDGPSALQVADVLGPRFRRMRQAHLASANGVGFELFQLIDPPHVRGPDEVAYWSQGFFHICVTDPDIGTLVDRIAATGGAQLSKIWQERPPAQDMRMCYCRDPFGNVIEVYTHSYELMQGHR